MFLCPWNFSRQEYWSEWPFPSREDLLDSGIEPESPALTGRFFTTEPPGKPCLMNSKSQFEVGFADSQCLRNVYQFINFGHFVRLAISIILSARQLDHTQFATL